MIKCKQQNNHNNYQKNIIINTLPNCIIYCIDYLKLKT